MITTTLVMIWKICVKKLVMLCTCGRTTSCMKIPFHQNVFLAFNKDEGFATYPAIGTNGSTTDIAHTKCPCHTTTTTPTTTTISIPIPIPTTTTISIPIPTTTTVSIPSLPRQLPFLLPSSVLQQLLHVPTTTCQILLSTTTWLLHTLLLKKKNTKYKK